MKHGKKIAVRGLSSVVALSICGLGVAAISAFADAPEAPRARASRPSSPRLPPA